MIECERKWYGAVAGHGDGGGVGGGRRMRAVMKWCGAGGGGCLQFLMRCGIDEAFEVRVLTRILFTLLAF